MLAKFALRCCFVGINFDFDPLQTKRKDRSKLLIRVFLQYIPLFTSLGYLLCSTDYIDQKPLHPSKDVIIYKVSSQVVDIFVMRCFHLQPKTFENVYACIFYAFEAI